MVNSVTSLSAAQKSSSVPTQSSSSTPNFDAVNPESPRLSDQVVSPNMRNSCFRIHVLTENGYLKNNLQDMTREQAEEALSIGKGTIMDGESRSFIIRPSSKGLVTADEQYNLFVVSFYDSKDTDDIKHVIIAQDKSGKNFEFDESNQPTSEIVDVVQTLKNASIPVVHRLFRTDNIHHHMSAQQAMQALNDGAGTLLEGKKRSFIIRTSSFGALTTNEQYKLFAVTFLKIDSATQKSRIGSFLIGKNSNDEFAIFNSANEMRETIPNIATFLKKYSSKI